MSSFIVSKQEFIKAAGLMCGYEEAKRHSHKWFIEHVRQEFEHAYALNVVSVQEQYKDYSFDPEEETLDDVFEAYRKMGSLIYTEGYKMGIICTKVADVMDKPTFRKSMWNFFRSVLYQIENEAAHRAVAELFFTCLSKLYEDEMRSVEGWWGEVELDVKPTKVA
jgi:hypothetical protein